MDLERGRQARGAAEGEAGGTVPEASDTGFDVALQAVGRDQHQRQGARADEAGGEACGFDCGLDGVAVGSGPAGIATDADTGRIGGAGAGGEAGLNQRI